MTCLSNFAWCPGPQGRGKKCLKCQTQSSKQPATATTSRPLPAQTKKPVFGHTAKALTSTAHNPRPVPVPAIATTSTTAKLSQGVQQTDAGLKVNGKTVGALLGEGSYKKAYAFVGDTSTVLISLDKSKKGSLQSEMTSLNTLRAAGIRVVNFTNTIYNLPDNRIGIIMEKLEGEEVKETRFGMTSAKNKILQVANQYGLENAINQFQAVDDYIQANGGISDLQFVLSPSKGMVLFDPATLKTRQKNTGVASVIKFLQKELQKKSAEVTV